MAEGGWTNKAGIIALPDSHNSLQTVFYIFYINRKKEL